MEEGDEEEGQVDAAVADDRAGEGDHDPDDEHPREGKEDAKPAKGAQDGVFCEPAEVAAVLEVMNEGENDDPPDEEELDGKEEVERPAARSGERFEESVLPGDGQDAEQACPGSVQGRQGQAGMALQEEKFVLVTGNACGQVLEGGGEEEADGRDNGEENQGSAEPGSFPEEPAVNGGEEEEGDGGADPDDEQKANNTINHSLPGESVVQEAMYIMDQETDEHIQDRFAVDTGCPEQNGGKEENGEGRQGVVGKPVAEGAKEGDGAQENGEGEEQGIGV